MASSCVFVISINDLERNIKSNFKFLADDTMLFSIVKDPVISANNLNRYLGIICQWGPINGKCSLILTPLSRQLKSYCLVSNLVQPIRNLSNLL